ncbi:MAG: aminopeptidase P family protein [Chloroflexota bacterium]|nr:aminopeptidase P family protein [Chloroflexota bacterium]
MLGALPMPMDAATFRGRRERAAAAARAAGIAALLVSPGSDLAYLTGHRIHESERLTCLVLASDGAAALVVPELEAPRARTASPGLEVRTWSETDDPIALVAGLVPRGGDVAVGDRMWAAFVLGLRSRLDGRSLVTASRIVAPLRMRKDEHEISALRAAGEAADRVYERMRAGSFAGRAESEVSAELRALLAAEGHDDTFAIVASGPNGASPHHDAGERRIAAGDTVVLDFGGTRGWYCSDITRTVHVGDGVDAERRRVHDVVRRAQEAGYAAARAGATASSVDAAARRVIDGAGYGAYFIHRVGHGIGLDGHEDPYLVRGNDVVLEPGMAFSIEPGVYLPGRFGVRIEDVAYVDASGAAQPLNTVDRSLAIVR